MNYAVYKNIFTTFKPRKIEVGGLTDIPKNNLIIYGEIHGAQENANIIYTLCSELNIQCLAIEYSSKIDKFIRLAVTDIIDFSLVDTTMFDSSILSLEMLRTIVEMLKTGLIKEIKFLDDTFDYTSEQLQNFDFENRERIIADNILVLDKAIPTLCILGNWHARPRKIDNHVSALIEVRKLIPSAILIYNRYRKGSIRNAGNIMKMRANNRVPINYTIIQRNINDYDLIVPEAHPIEV